MITEILVWTPSPILSNRSRPAPGRRLANNARSATGCRLDKVPNRISRMPSLQMPVSRRNGTENVTRTVFERLVWQCIIRDHFANALLQHNGCETDENATKQHHCQAEIMPASVRYIPLIWHGRSPHTSLFLTLFLSFGYHSSFARASCHQCHSSASLFFFMHNDRWSLDVRRSLTSMQACGGRFSSDDSERTANGIVCDVCAVILISRLFRCIVIRIPHSMECAGTTERSAG